MAETGWKPIESAPRDGTLIDVWLEDADESDLDFYCPFGTKRSCNWYWRDGKFRPCGGLASLVTFVKPTHWMPLPEPPGGVDNG